MDEVEAALVRIALEFPAYGQVRAVSKLLEQTEHQISPAGVPSVWQRNNLETKKMRLKALEAKVAKEGCVLTESQLQLLEQAQAEKDSTPPPTD